jgi:MFS family permease
MPKFDIQNFSHFSLVSVGVMTTMTFGFVPFLNLVFHYGIDVMWMETFWMSFGFSSLLCGMIIDKIKNKNYFFLSFIIWGALALCLIFFYGNVQISLFLVLLLGIFTGPNVIIGTSYIGSNIQINKRGLNAGLYLGIGWGFVSVTAVISAFNIFLNIIILGIINIIVGVVSFYLIRTKKLELKYQPLITIPRDFDVKRAGLVYWTSTLVFGMFLGIIVFLLGANTRFFEANMPMSFYLKNLAYYVQFADTFGLGLINLDFLAIGGMNLVLSPVFGKLMDKYGRKHIFFISNMLIPTVLVFLVFWEIFAFMIISVAFYSTITASYVIIICTVWSDFSPKNNMARFNGYGWSSVAIGGGLGFIIANIMTLPALNQFIDTMILVTIFLISEFSLIPFVFMKESLPPAEEMEWDKELIHLYVINEGGIVLIDYSFQKSEQVDADLFVGGISGVQAILQEMTKSDQKLKIIDHEDKKLLFEYGKQFSVSLLASKDLKILRTKLKNLTEEIQNVFWETIASWDGSIEVFKPINTMIRNHFSI